MGIKDIQQNVVIKVSSDTRDAARGMANLGSAIEGVTVDAAAMGEKVSGTQTIFSRFASAAKSGLDGLGSAAGGVKSAFSEMGANVKSLAETMAPFNQAIELGGKFIRGAEAALDAYAKRSPEAAKEVKALKKEFSDLKDEVLGAAGALTVDLLKGIDVLSLYKQERDKFLGEHDANYAKTLKAAEDTASIFEKALDPGQLLANARDAFVNGNDKWGASPLEVIESTLKTHNKKVEAEVKRHNDWLKNHKFTVAELTKSGGTDTAGAPIGYSLGSAAGYDGRIQVGGINTSLGEAAGTNDAGISAAFASTKSTADAVLNNANTAADRYQQFIDKPGQTLLEKLGLDKPDAWDTAVAALQAFSVAWQSSLEAIATSNESIGKIFKKGLGVVVHALGDKLAAESAAELVEAGAHGILGDLPGAARHAGAGALYGAGAVAAYKAAKSLGFGEEDSKAKSTAPAATAGASGTGGSGSGNGQSDKGTNTTIIVYGDNYAEDSPRMRQLRAERLVKTATGSSSVDHS